MASIIKYLWYCHRLPNRSFFYHGKQFPVCARCTGVWAGYAISIIPVILFVIPWWWGILAIVPMITDGGTQLLHWRSSTNWLRFFTGVSGGVGEMIIFSYLGRLAFHLGYLVGS